MASRPSEGTKSPAEGGGGEHRKAQQRGPWPGSNSIGASAAPRPLVPAPAKFSRIWHPTHIWMVEWDDESEIGGNDEEKRRKLVKQGPENWGPTRNIDTNQNNIFAWNRNIGGNDDDVEETMKGNDDGNDDGMAKRKKPAAAGDDVPQLGFRWFWDECRVYDEEGK
jgi:hypothetical protein